MKKFTSNLGQQWINFYLPTILKRKKLVNTTEPLKIDNIVITVENNVSDLWRLGKIVEVTKGSKGQVRQVTIRLGKNNYWSGKNLSSGKLIEKNNY